MECECCMYGRPWIAVWQFERSRISNNSATPEQQGAQCDTQSFTGGGVLFAENEIGAGAAVEVSEPTHDAPIPSIQQHHLT